MGDSGWKMSQHCRMVWFNLVNVAFIVLAAFTLAFMLMETELLKQYGQQHGYGNFYSAVFIIIACLILSVVSFYGIFAAMTQHLKSLYIYLCFMVMLLGLLLFIIVFASSQRTDLHYKVSDWMKKDFFQNSTGLDLCDQQRLWDDLQTTYVCCGLSGPLDYMAVGKLISRSCCTKSYYGKTAGEQTLLNKTDKNCIGSLIAQGCEDVIVSMLTFDGEWLITVAIMNLCLVFLAMLLSLRVIENAIPHLIDDLEKSPL